MVLWKLEVEGRSPEAETCKEGKDGKEEKEGEWGNVGKEGRGKRGKEKERKGGRRRRSETKLSVIRNNLGVLLHSTVTVDDDDILCSFDKPKERN